jgi:ATP/maltotriose-dependent transcriptional regulator MalT
VGRAAEAERAAVEAVDMLEELEPGRELAAAYGGIASFHSIADRDRLALEWGSKAAELAERVGDANTLAHALTTVGAAQLRLRMPEAEATLARSLEVAEQHELGDQIVRIYSLAGNAALEVHDFPRAQAYLEAGLGFLDRLGVTDWQDYLLAVRGELRFKQGAWAEATEDVERVLARPQTLPLARVMALAVLARVRARRGDPGVWEPLDEARAIAAPTGEPQQVCLVAAAAAEAALIAGDADAVRGLTDEALALALERGHQIWAGELGVLRRRAGIREVVPTLAEPYALELAGDVAGAATRWDELGRPYEAASALAQSDDPDDLREALARLQRLGAAPAAAAVARRLHLRGPRASTLENPAGLTRREVDVLELVAAGLTNSEIAERLVLSTRTVDHHVSAVLGKLGARSRAEASAEAVRLGLAR